MTTRKPARSRAERVITPDLVRQALAFTGLPIVVCFDSGNLVTVAQAVREELPDALLVICGDDDQATQQRTGRNPGRAKAGKALAAIERDGARSLAVFPSELPEGGSDFNDMHRHAGLEAVRACVLAAIERGGSGSAHAMKPADDAAGKPARKRARRDQPDQADGEADASSERDRAIRQVCPASTTLSCRRQLS